MKVFDETRVAAAAEAIKGELLKLLDRNDYNSAIEERLSVSMHYYSGMTTFERQLGILRALAMVQIEITADLASLTADESDPEAPLSTVLDDTELLDRLG